MNARKKTTVLVVTHKLFDDTKLPVNGYRVIKVGSQIEDEECRKRGWLEDDTGDNIADKNPLYCELTAYYWAWKNLKDIDIIGICHYRRFFMDYHKDSRDIFSDILSEERIIEILKKRSKKIIISYLSVKPQKMTDQVIKNGYWGVIGDILEKEYPSVYPAFLKVLKSPYAIYGNMLITHKSIFDEYCAWLFDVLNRFDALCTDRGIPIEPRVNGFLAEELLLVWVKWKFLSNEIYPAEIRNTEIDNLKMMDYSKSPRGKILKRIKCNRQMLFIYRKMAIPYLLVTRRMWK